MELIQGVTLLRECTGLNTKLFMTIVLIFCAVAALIHRRFVRHAHRNRKIKAVLFCSVFIFISIFGMKTLLKSNKPNGEYEVEVDNSVNMNEFYKRYEVIHAESDGRYIIKLREQ